MKSNCEAEIQYFSLFYFSVAFSITLHFLHLKPIHFHNHPKTEDRHRWSGRRWLLMVDWKTVQLKGCEKKSAGNRAEERVKQRNVEAILVRKQNMWEWRRKSSRETSRAVWKPAVFPYCLNVQCFRNRFSQFLILNISSKGNDLIWEQQILLTPLAPETSINT